MKNFLVLFYCIILGISTYGQSGNDSIVTRQDSLPLSPDSGVTLKNDSPIGRTRSHQIIADTVAARKTDTLNPLPAVDINWAAIIGFQLTLQKHRHYNFFGKSVVISMDRKMVANKDWLFYLLVGLIFYFALINVFFGKYLSNVMALFFRVTMRQQQLREQVLQAPLPSLLLNIFFILSAGLFLAFVAYYYKWIPVDNLMLLWLYSILLLLIIYLGKFFVLKLVGWVFGVQGATDTYIFIVFLVNKMIGIFLIPVLLMMAFPHAAVFQVIVTLSLSMIIILFIYRFFISYRPVRSEIKVNPFHFFIYLCAFEIAPLLLIYKVLLKLVESSN